MNYFAFIFGTESRKEKEALNKMEEVMAKEHEMLSLGGQAAAALILWNTIVNNKDYFTGTFITI